MTDDTTPQEDAAMSPVSTGSVDALAGDRETTGSLTHDDIMAEADQFIRDDRSGWTLVYKMRAEIARLRLTDEEREAVAFFAELRGGDFPSCLPHAATLRKLLERLK